MAASPTSATTAAARRRPSTATSPDGVVLAWNSDDMVLLAEDITGYVGADGQWYVGYQTCTPSGTTAPGACGTREVLAGPINPITADTLTSGLFFVYYDQYGVRKTALSAADTLARISVGIRTTSESLRRATGSTSTMAGGDSLRFIVGIRNRI